MSLHFRRAGWSLPNPCRLFQLLFAFVIALTLCGSALAQSTTDGAIGGTVYDVNGAVVPNATVVVHNNGTNAEQRIATDASGYYRVRALQPATYTVTVSSQGFAPYKAENVIVQVGSLTDVSPRLGVAGAAETVTVSAETPQINTATPDFAPVVDFVQINNLPINGGRWSAFSVLTPGVVNDSNGFGLVSFRGMSTLLNNNTVDGADNNQAFFSEERGRTRAGYSTPLPAIQEFQVNTSNYSAEYGRSAGGVVNTVTRSGSNQLHSEMYFYDRDNDWGSKNPFTLVPIQTSPGVFTPTIVKPKDWRKMSGIGIGGPILKDKLFFYFVYDWYDRNFPAVASPSTPNAFFAAPSTSNISLLATRLGVTTTQAQTIYNNSFTGLTSMLGTVPRTGEQYIWFPKIDWQVNQKNRLSFDVNRMRWASPSGIQTQTNNTRGIASFGNDFVKDTWGVAKLDTLLTNTLTNELRVQYGRDFEYENPQNPSPYELANLVHSPLFPTYVNPLGLPPDVASIPNGFEFGVPTFLTRPHFPDEKRQQYADTVSWQHGNHSIKFGVDYTHVYDLSENLATQFGSYSYSASTGLIDYISDINKPKSCSATVSGVANTPVPCYSNFSQSFGPLGFNFTTNDYAFFGQDDWKMSPRLTLSLGLRWEDEQLPSPFSNLVNPTIPQTGNFPADKNNFGPRVGFAYDMFGTGKTVVRGGWGLYYGRVINSTIFSALTATGMPGSQFNFTFSPTSAGAPVFPQILTAQPNTTIKPNVAFFDNHFQLPQIQEFDLNAEQDLGWNTVVKLSYLGALGRELPDFADVNIAPSTTNLTYTVCGARNSVASCGSPGAGPIQNSTISIPIFTSRPNSSFGAMTDIFSGPTSNYNALAVQLNHRMSKHIEFSTNITWSHALDFGVNNQTFSATNSLLVPFNTRADYGNSLTNVPLRYVFNAVAESPWHIDGWLGQLANGWQLAPIFQWQNGLPYSVRTSGNIPSGLPGNPAGLPGGGINGSGGDFRVPGFARNDFQMPNTQVLDLKLSKNLSFHDRYRVELSGEAFNVFNHFNVTGVSTTAYFVNKETINGVVTPTLEYSSGVYGTPTAANSNFAYATRQVQLGVRLSF
jgi:outer membrane receptor protein involved in Fe transport